MPELAQQVGNPISVQAAIVELPAEQHWFGLHRSFCPKAEVHMPLFFFFFRFFFYLPASASSVPFVARSAANPLPAASTRWRRSIRRASSPVSRSNLESSKDSPWGDA